MPLGKLFHVRSAVLPVPVAPALPEIEMRPDTSDTPPEPSAHSAPERGLSVPSGLPMSELIQTLRARPDLKHPIQHIVQRRDMDEPAKMSAILRIVREKPVQ